MNEQSVASILISLSGQGERQQSIEDDERNREFELWVQKSAKDATRMIMDKIKNDVANSLIFNEDIDLNEIIKKDRSGCSTKDLEMIRKERNRMHAKKTRLRKKKMTHEMENVNNLSLNLSPNS